MQYSETCCMTGRKQSGNRQFSTVHLRVNAFNLTGSVFPTNILDCLCVNVFDLMITRELCSYTSWHAMLH